MSDMADVETQLHLLIKGLTSTHQRNDGLTRMVCSSADREQIVKAILAAGFGPVQANMRPMTLVEIAARDRPEQIEAELRAAHAQTQLLKRWKGELRSLGKHLDHWESQGHTTVTIRFLRFWVRDRATEFSQP